MRLLASLLSKVLLAAGGLGVGLLLAEGLVRLRDPESTFGAATEKLEFREGGKAIRRAYTVDPDMGFRPILGSGRYTETGTLPNRYALEKRPGVTRLLFVGDSVTAQGRIVEHLRRLYGEGAYEYWNAGVHSFNTVQEVKYYARYNAVIRPDHVILTFHNNDFEETPVAFLDEGGRLVVYSPAVALAGGKRWLFRHSQLYRFLLGWSVRLRPGEGPGVAETRRALAALQAMLARQGARLSVVLLPILKPLPGWSDGERASHARSRGIFEQLGLRYFDLTPALGAALAATPEDHRDSWHPAEGAALQFAEYLRDNRLLELAGGR